MGQNYSKVLLFSNYGLTVTVSTNEWCVGCYHYALILVNLVTHYTWTFDLKTLSSDCILVAHCLVHASAGSLAQCFYCDCDAKHFGKVLIVYFMDNGFKVAVTPTKHQSSKGLVESHWKVMVHMACVFTHAMRMMNAFPGKIMVVLHLLSYTFMAYTWVPLFSLCYFYHENNGDFKSSMHQAHMMDGIIVDCL